jgi:hypothetical protein
MATDTLTMQAPDEVDEAAHLAAVGYIRAIVARDPLARQLGDGWACAEADRLYDQFLLRYLRITTGAYARRGQDAIRAALAGI